jgi:TBC domain-containing protein kinase-like protein
MEIDKMFGLGSAKLAMTSFVACRHPAESCGHNGLPLTPNSIAILGQAEGLKSLEHQNLCTYLDFARGKNERVICVSEFYENNLKAAHEVGPKDLLHIAGQVLALLDFLQSQEVVVMNLSTSTVLLSDDNTVKLFNYSTLEPLPQKSLQQDLCQNAPHGQKLKHRRPKKVLIPSLTYSQHPSRHTQ